ncbi:MAG: DMT family transporter [Pontixanthobacter sp.]
MTDSQSGQRPILALLIRLAAAFMLSVMLVMVKLASESGIGLVQILFWRQLPSIPIILMWLALNHNLHLLRSERMGKHLQRAMFGLCGMFLNFGAVTLLPLAEATTFGFTSAIWAVILSAILLKEKVGIWRWGAVMTGFAGVIIIAQPGNGHVPLYGALCALGAAFMIALISIQIRDLTRTENSLVIVFFFAAFSLPLLALGLPFSTSAASPYQWGVLAALGISGLLGQFLLTNALRFGAVSSVIVMDYSSLIWATAFGWLIFDHLPPSMTWFGAPLIVAAGLTIAWREHRMSKRKNLVNLDG